MSLTRIVPMSAGGEAGLLSRIQGLAGVNPVNQMPREPNQQPSPGQKKLLPKDRVPSSIPKGGTDTAWLYPSPQMFYNGAASNLSSISYVCLHSLRLV